MPTRLLNGLGLQLFLASIQTRFCSWVRLDGTISQESAADIWPAGTELPFDALWLQTNCICNLVFRCMTGYELCGEKSTREREKSVV